MDNVIRVDFDKQNKTKRMRSIKWVGVQPKDSWLMSVVSGIPQKDGAKILSVEAARKKKRGKSGEYIAYMDNYECFYITRNGAVHFDEIWSKHDYLQYCNDNGLAPQLDGSEPLHPLECPDTIYNKNAFDCLK